MYKGKIGKFILMVLLICFISGISVFADIPQLTVVIGDRGYSLQDIDNKEMGKIIKDTENIYIKDNKGEWIDIKNNKVVTKEEIPKITLVDSKGNKIVYDEHDGEIIEEESDKILLEIFVRDNVGGIGQAIEGMLTFEGYKELYTSAKYQVYDENNEPITPKMEMNKTQYFYPKIEKDNLKVNIYDFKNNLITSTENLNLLDGKISIFKSKLKKIDDIFVSTSEEFVNAIAPYRTIKLKKGIYDLRDFEKDNSYIEYKETIDGYEFELVGLNNITIEGIEDDVIIICDSNYADIMKLTGCNDVTFKNIKFMRKSTEKNIIGRGVILDNCESIKIIECEIIGSNSEGLKIETSNNVKVFNSKIKETTNGIMSIQNSKNIEIIESRFIDNGIEFGIEVNGDCDKIWFNNSEFINNHIDGAIFDIHMVHDYDFIISDCLFKDNKVTKLFECNLEDGIQTLNVIIEENNKIKEYKSENNQDKVEDNRGTVH
ncbi:right-handed parallel beta-helix repeat-containing protein [Oceanirhabdus sp. W0125-5]|uniref:right-handed parallel beta-helix repeat-containing protein n=1 Tax=Oceanirhabdus sp. W0125-5 TaxID=2999116 RepID=UPI0022F32E6A|nr:right-handed parallel beta-helix repeat-containing protein [Oceanirhabdus sp. W0125-5]WBW96612.1 right-handed parallel beta-helix repeat-containing protein [Oceanirhabdus sp. W0125-5]